MSSDLLEAVEILEMILCRFHRDNDGLLGSTSEICLCGSHHDTQAQQVRITIIQYHQVFQQQIRSIHDFTIDRVI